MIPRQGEQGPEPDGAWTKSGAADVAKMILGRQARVGEVDGRCVLWLDTPKGRAYIGSADTWEGLIRSMFVEPFKGREP